MEASSTTTRPTFQRAKILGAFVVGTAALALFARWAVVMNQAAPAPATGWAPAAAPSGKAGSSASAPRTLHVSPSSTPGATLHQTHDESQPSGAPPTMGQELRPMDKEIFDALARGGLTNDQLGDVFPKAPYRVEFIRLDGNGMVSNIRVDSKRSGSWDELWSLGTDGVERENVLNNNPNGPKIPFKLFSGRWLAH